MGDFDSVRNVNTLYNEGDGRLWIGTGDNGLSVLEEDQIVRIIDPSDGLPSWSVRAVVHSSDGYCYVGTTNGTLVLSREDDFRPVWPLEELTYVTSLSADSNGLVAAVSYGTLYLLREGQILLSRQPEGNQPWFSCCQFDLNGRLLAGTEGNRMSAMEN